jgi:hypothetical protein
MELNTMNGYKAIYMISDYYKDKNQKANTYWKLAK